MREMGMRCSSDERQGERSVDREEKQRQRKETSSVHLCLRGFCGHRAFQCGRPTGGIYRTPSGRQTTSSRTNGRKKQKATSHTYPVNSRQTAVKEMQAFSIPFDSICQVHSCAHYDVQASRCLTTVVTPVSSSQGVWSHPRLPLK